ncbi:Dabb family protein [Mycolicibacterium gilvum]|uniref:Stress responsive A/B Barrel Domain-containing protein n=2 Tax=Mycolicibacterium gilvum TaxID=1804 RepID=E6TNB8_MYCSR|nr:Dabb family protein [Mycolicibacterium gilvum]ADU00545.1 Stress responsive A/B Barrel Domain-containing protein [Mycolicibacterium gilvum Spyr1]
MYSVIRLLDVAEPERDRVLRDVQAAAARTGAHRTVVEPTLPGSRNGGDVLVHLRFQDEDEWRCHTADFEGALQDSAITRVNGAEYPGRPQPGHPGPSGVYRTLLLRVLPGTEPSVVARFEDELRLMPRYVRSITAWQLSRAQDPTGDAGWTHVFEQQFTDEAGLMGPYLMHPIHWAVVDRWFDPETTDVIIRDRVCHSFCALPAPVLD